MTGESKFFCMRICDRWEQVLLYGNMWQVRASSSVCMWQVKAGKAIGTFYRPLRILPSKWGTKFFKTFPTILQPFFCVPICRNVSVLCWLYFSKYCHSVIITGDTVCVNGGTGVVRRLKCASETAQQWNYKSRIFSVC